jgi:hypothetical protein
LEKWHGSAAKEGSRLLRVGAGFGVGAGGVHTV